MSLKLTIDDCYDISDYLAQRLSKSGEMQLYWKLVEQGLSRLEQSNLALVKTFIHDQARLRVQNSINEHEIATLEKECREAYAAMDVSLGYWSRVKFTLLKTVPGYLDVEIVRRLTRAKPLPGQIYVRGATKHSSRRDKYGRALSLDELLLQCPSDNALIAAPAA